MSDLCWFGKSIKDMTNEIVQPDAAAKAVTLPTIEKQAEAVLSNIEKNGELKQMTQRAKGTASTAKAASTASTASKGSGRVFFCPYGDLLNTRGKPAASTKKAVLDHLTSVHAKQIEDALTNNLQLITNPKIIDAAAKIIATNNAVSKASQIPAASDMDEKAFQADKLTNEMLGNPKRIDLVDEDDVKELKNIEEETQETVQNAASEATTKEAEQEIAQEAKKGNKLSQTKTLTKIIFTSVMGKPRAEWKKTLKQFFDEMNISAYENVPPNFITEFNALVKDNKVDNTEFTTALYTLLEKYKPEIERIQRPLPTQDELAQDIETMEDAAKASKPVKPPTPKGKKVQHKEIADPIIPAKSKSAKAQEGNAPNRHTRRSKSAPTNRLND